LHSQAAQQVLLSVFESFKSFKELDNKYLQGELHFRPKFPNYRQKNRLLMVTYPQLGEKPEGWKRSRNRIKRGIYRTGTGKIINADLNGAANILRKVETQLGLCLVKVCRRRQVLTLATRFRIWETKTRNRNGAALALRIATV
jgi:transposase